MSMEEIALACVAECHRQDVGLDGLACLVAAYAYAVDNAYRLPTEVDVLHLAAVIEPKTDGRYRTTPVTFTSGTGGAEPSTIPGAVARMFDLLDEAVDPVDFVRQLLVIHPFADGNGRVAFVLINWLGHHLDVPIALPEFDFA
jgi:hypothetical protein